MVAASITTRATVAVTVIVIHALLLLLFQNSTRGRSRSISEPLMYLVLVPAVANKLSEKRQRDKQLHFPSVGIRIPDVSVNVAESSPATPNSSTNIDWEREANVAAKTAAKQSGAKKLRSFGPSGRSL